MQFLERKKFNTELNARYAYIFWQHQQIYCKYVSQYIKEPLKGRLHEN